MDELMIKFAEILDMSVESVIMYYPILRNQMMWYNVLGSISALAMIITIVIAASLPFGILLIDSMYLCDDEEVKIKFFKSTVKFIIIATIIMITAKTGSFVLAKDIMMIKKFI